MQRRCGPETGLLKGVVKTYRFFRLFYQIFFQKLKSLNFRFCRKTLKIQILVSQSQQNIVAFQCNCIHSYAIMHMAINDDVGWERMYHA